MGFHPPLVLFVAVGLGGMVVATLLAIVVEKIDRAMTSQSAAAGEQLRAASSWAVGCSENGLAPLCSIERPKDVASSTYARTRELHVWFS
jgi:hypothetical protein